MGWLELENRSSYKQFTRKEEAELFDRWKNQGDAEAYDLLVKSQLYWVRKLTWKYMNRWGWTNQEEAQAAAEDGLLYALSKFDPAQGRLTTYCAGWVFQRMHHRFGQDTLIKTPHNPRESSAGTIKTLRKTYSLDCSKGEKGIEPIDPLSVKDVVQEENSQRLRSLLARALRQLEKRDRRVFLRRFKAQMTLKEVGDSLGLTRERIRQIEERALRKLQDILTTLCAQEGQTEFLESLLPRKYGKPASLSIEGRHYRRLDMDAEIKRVHALLLEIGPHPLEEVAKRLEISIPKLKLILRPEHSEYFVQGSKGLYRAVKRDERLSA